MTPDEVLAEAVAKDDDVDALAHAISAASGFAFHMVSVDSPRVSRAVHAAVRARIEAVDGDAMEWLVWDAYRDPPAGPLSGGTMTREQLLAILERWRALAPPDRRRYVWLDASAALDADVEVWGWFWSRVNLLRNTFMRTLDGVLVVSFPSPFMSAVWETAPDTWSVRTRWTQIGIPTPAPPELLFEDRSGEPPEPPKFEVDVEGIEARVAADTSPPSTWETLSTTAAPRDMPFERRREDVAALVERAAWLARIVAREPDVRHRRMLAWAYQELALVFEQGGDHANCARMATRAVACFRRLTADDGGVADDGVAMALVQLASAEIRLRTAHAARVHAAEAVEIQRARSAAQPSNPWMEVGLEVALTKRGDAEFACGDLAAAIDSVREQLAILADLDARSGSLSDSTLLKAIERGYATIRLIRLLAVAGRSLEAARESARLLAMTGAQDAEERRRGWRQLAKLAAQLLAVARGDWIPPPSSPAE